MPIASYRLGVAYTALGDLDSGEQYLREAIASRGDLYDRAMAEPLLDAHHEWLQEEVVKSRKSG